MQIRILKLFQSGLPQGASPLNSNPSKGKVSLTFCIRTLIALGLFKHHC